MTTNEALRVLGVEWGTTDENFIARARRNWRRLILQCHPDRGGDLERAKDLNEAMEVVRAMSAPSRTYYSYRGHTSTDIEEILQAAYQLAFGRVFGGAMSFWDMVNKVWPSWGHTDK